MFGWFDSKSRDEAKAKKKYEALLEAARDLQRAGKIQAFAAKTAEAERAMHEWEALIEANQAAASNSK